MPITTVSSKLVTQASDLTGTGQVTLYTAPANHTAIVRALIVNNSDSTARNILVQLNDGSTTTNIFEARAIAANSSEALINDCLLYTSPSPRDVEESRMPSSA